MTYDCEMWMNIQCQYNKVTNKSTAQYYYTPETRRKRKIYTNAYVPGLTILYGIFKRKYILTKAHNSGY